MRRQLRPAVAFVVVSTVVLGAIYPLMTWALGSVLFSDKVDGSLVRRNGEVVGSALLGQEFTGPQWFHGRPEPFEGSYADGSSGSSNLGPSNDDLAASVAERARLYRVQNRVPRTTGVPIDAVTSSGSGLDPHISAANARLQARRVAAARGVAVDRVLAAIDDATATRPLGILGDEGVNVLRLNIAVADLADLADVADVADGSDGSDGAASAGTTP